VSRQAWQAPGVVEVRLSGTSEDTATVISVLERLASGLPVTTMGWRSCTAPVPGRIGATPGNGCTCSSG
jgi:hypothetical protein